MGPVEMLGTLADSMRFVSLDGGIVKSAQGVPVMTEKFVSEDPVRILLVPGAAPQVLPKEKAFFRQVMPRHKKQNMCSRFVQAHFSWRRQDF